MNPKNYLMCVAEFRARPDTFPALNERLQELVRLTRQEAGCLQYDLSHSTEHPRTCVVIERFRSKADFDAHSSQGYLQSFIRDLDSLVESASVHLCEQAVQVL